MERFIMIDNAVLLVNNEQPCRKGDQYIWISHDEKHIIPNGLAIIQLESPGKFLAKYKKINIVWAHIPKDKDEYIVTLVKDFT
jgi:hypothetical protein